MKTIDLWHKMEHIQPMPSLKDKPRRSERLVARIAPEDKALLEHAAALEGASVASFVVSHLRSAAREVIQQHEVIRLNARESRRFMDALLAPPGKAPKRFQKALRLHQGSVRES